MHMTDEQVNSQTFDAADSQNEGVNPRDYTVMLFDDGENGGDGLDCWSPYCVEADTVGEAVEKAAELWKEWRFEGYPDDLDPDDKVSEHAVFKVYPGRLGGKYYYDWGR